MTKREKQKSKFDFEEEEEDESKKSSKSITQVSSSDDEEANEDLTLKIVEKSLLMRAAKFAQNDRNDAVLSDNIDAVDLVLDSPQEAEVVVASKKKIKKGKKKVIEKISVTVGEEEMKIEEQSEKTEVVEDNPSDNIVLRKLLRGARYFDMPDNGGWETCYNCGEEGHMAVNCTSARRKKPCYVCGSLEHAARQCSKGQDCYICKKGGHRAKDCPEKYKSGSQNAKICLKCGYSGHDMFSCKNDYSHDDLKEIQCYICKSFGHLCCVNSADNNSREVSCYRCGQLGHTGLACGRIRAETTGSASSSSCYKCGEEGHFARECTSSAKVGRLLGETTGMASPSSCYKCGGEGHFARECISSAKVGIRGETTGLALPSSCYKCGEEGHFARECTSSALNAIGRLRGETTGTASPSSCYKCGEGGHFARECMSSVKVGKRNRELSTPTLRPHREHKDRSGFRSAPHDHDKAHKRKKTQYEGGITTPQKSKHRGGWITEDPGDFSGRNSKKDRWKSPSTPSKERHKISTLTAGGHISSPKSLKNRTPSNIKFSASRFHNSGGDEKRRDYNWW